MEPGTERALISTIMQICKELREIRKALERMADDGKENSSGKAESPEGED